MFCSQIHNFHILFLLLSCHAGATQFCFTLGKFRHFNQSEQTEVRASLWRHSPSTNQDLSHRSHRRQRRSFIVLSPACTQPCNFVCAKWVGRILADEVHFNRGLTAPRSTPLIWITPNNTRHWEPFSFNHRERNSAHFWIINCSRLCFCCFHVLTDDGRLGTLEPWDAADYLHVWVPTKPTHTRRPSGARELEVYRR